MGFYGNITNTSRTQFQFDKTYPNRATMDNHVNIDGIFIGRYVLVEYDTQFGADWCTIAFQKTINGTLHFYSDAKATPATELFYGEGNLIADRYIRIPGVYTIPGTENSIVHNLDNPKQKLDLLYRIQPGTAGELISVKSLKELQGVPYNDNYTIDAERYGPSRGYDSTVWQKVFTDGTERYVMIAELNTIIPTFDIAADAPTSSPLIPHFDGDSSNVYYKVHWQPSWGFRIKSAYKDLLVHPVDDAGVTVPKIAPVSASSVSEDDMPSDEYTIWKKDGYDKNQSDPKKRYKHYIYKILDKNANPPTGTWVEDTGKTVEANQIPAAIYYNKDGFNPRIISYNNDIADTIKIEPTGVSGHYYNAHDGSYTTKVQADTQELSILLPSIGNAVAALWDIVYGNSELNNNTNVRDTSITWNTVGSIIPKNRGLRLVNMDEKGYLVDKEKVSTLAGSINSMHDLMGMIIQEVDTKKDSVNSKSKNYIFYDKNLGKFYRKHKGYNYTKFTPTKVNTTQGHTFFEEVTLLEDAQEFLKNCYYLENTPYSNIYNYIKETTYDNSLANNYYEVTGVVEANYDSSFSKEKDKIYEKLTTKEGESYYVLTKDENFLEEKIGIYHLIPEKSIKALPANTFLYSYGRPFGSTTILRIKSSEIVDNPTYADFEQGALYEKKNNKFYQANVNGEDFDSTKDYYRLTFISADHDRILAGISNNEQFFSILTEKITSETTLIVNVSYVEVPGITETNFIAGMYFIYDDSEKEYKLAMVYEEGKKYYSEYKQLTTQTIEIIPPKDVQTANIVNFMADRHYQVIKNNKKEIEYHLIRTLDRLATMNGPYVEILPNNINNTLDGFYIPNMYWYKVPSGARKDSYVLDSSLEPVKNRIYYREIQITKKTEQLNDIVVYEAHKYYYKKGDSYILDLRPNATEGVQYYKKNGLYVLEDSEGRLPVYKEWNYKITQVPSSVSLGTRAEKWEYQELQEFAQGMNTVHGLLLRIHDLMEFYDVHTRDNNVQGVLNRMNDLLSCFEDLKPSSIVTTDSYGNLTSATLADIILKELSANLNDTSSLSKTDSILKAFEKIEARLSRIETSLNLL